MNKVMVYWFKAWSVDAGEDLLSKSMATKDEIERRSGTPILESALEVDESQLDQFGRYYPPPTP